MKSFPSIRAVAFALVTGALVAIPVSSAQADDVELHRLLHGPQRCDYVIALLMRHGVNNDSDACDDIAALHPLGHVQIPTCELGDLQLVSVHRQEGVASGCGPNFDVVIKNCSTREVCGARITLVGLFGRICPTSPNVTAKIDSLPAGAAVQINLTLPIEALAMGNLNGQPIGFNRLLVAVDSFDQFLESNEANNLRVFDLSAIPVAAVTEVSTVTETQTAIETASVETTTSVTQSVPPAATAAAVPAPAEAAQAATVQAAPDQADAISNGDLRTAIDQFNDGASVQGDDS
ncbi:hypothetical protein FYK55_06635 [Roseiconus nitratireducens]|uniref:CARDB protein n=1 Tax=Roseiconus nitratireducens TaxID=2605748 RepID=A0A5M6DCP0_9BACT|nr:hypothetical protein [Roseiconus nitratireducens]KAA5545327.1 hypothetical protein FYK55_06635 [Roseiconus nitratireducens]